MTLSTFIKIPRSNCRPGRPSSLTGAAEFATIILTLHLQPQFAKRLRERSIHLHLKPLPAGPFNSVLALERRVTRDGMVSVGGNLYSVPDCTRRRTVEVQVTAGTVTILEDGIAVASHPALEGRGQRRIATGHRTQPPPPNSQTPREVATPPAPPLQGGTVTPRSLAIYDTIGRHLANQPGSP